MSGGPWRLTSSAFLPPVLFFSFSHFTQNLHGFMLVLLLVLTLLSPFCFEHTLMFSCLRAVLRCFSATKKHKALSPSRDKVKVSAGRWVKWKCWQVWALGELCSWWLCALHPHGTDPCSHSVRFSGPALSCGTSASASQPGKYESSYEASSIQFEERCPISWKSCAMWKEYDLCVCVSVRGWEK